MTKVLLFVACAAVAQAQSMDMQAISQALGVRCDYCHANTAGQKKSVALAMIAMTRDLNEKIQQATGKPPAETSRVDCITCHRGVPIPQPLSAIILRTVIEKGGAAAADQYRDLRKQFFGRATYDFSEDALLQMVQRVVQSKPDDAIALLRMSLDFNPQSAKTYAMIGFAYTRKSDDDQALANLKKSQELDPTDAMVRGRIEQLEEYRRRKLRQ
ncbi:MAG TPA: photosynthetic reaction center cytochrome c subunit family protein [Bryobacteraceae bacterium]|nr:photosynthetic reaction center cytochrome c subunit family protein [Bryobacteraceae bacterium]